MRAVSCCIISSILVGIVVVLLAAISYPVANNLMRKEITKRVVLTNGSQLYENWKDPQLPIYVQAFVFDLQNPEEVKKGFKPKLLEKGPFTYREHKIKVDIVHHDNGTVSYRQISSYFFDPDMSQYSEDINVTSVNIPILAIMDVLSHVAIPLPKGAVKFLVNAILKHVKDGDIFMTRSVKEIIWGYEEPLLKEVKKLKEKYPHILFFLPNITDDMVGVLAAKNNTDDGLYTIFTGEKNITRLGMIDKYNGKRKVDFWTTAQANMINGTDGTVCPPFIVSKDLVVQLFSTDICRSIGAVFKDKTSTPQGIELFRYSVPKEAFQKASINPNNKGFCTPADNCMGTGVLNVSVCQKANGMSLPIVVSNPHFFMAEKKYQDAVIGVDPTLPHLATEIDIEPHTGLVMQAAKRLQINVFFKNNTYLQSMNDIPTMVYPVLWVNESISIDNKTAHEFKSSLLNPLTILMVIQVILFGLGAFLIVLAAVLSGIWLSNKKRNEDEKDSSVTKVLINEEE